MIFFESYYRIICKLSPHIHLLTTMIR